MKKILWVFMPALFLLLLGACNTKTGNGYTIKMRLARGDKFEQNMEMDMNMNMNIAGISRDMKMKMITGSAFNVEDSSAAGRDIKITYTKMNMKMDMGLGTNINTDSILNKTMGGIVGKSVHVILAGNKITSVKGFDSLATAIQDTASAKMMQKMFSPESLNNTFGMLFSLYPNKSVKEGDSWTSDNVLDVSGMSMKIKTTYTLLRVKDNIAEIKMDGLIDSKGTMAQGAVNMEMDMKGSQKGQMNIKLSDGYLSTGNYDMDIDATINTMGQKLPLKMKATAKLTGQ